MKFVSKISEILKSTVLSALQIYVGDQRMVDGLELYSASKKWRIQNWYV